MSNCKAKERCQHLPKSRGEWLTYCEQCVYDSTAVGGLEHQKDNLKPYSVDELIAQLSTSQAREAELQEKLEAAEAQCAEMADVALRNGEALLSAEARIKASQEQEPHHWLLKPSASNTHVSLSRRELWLNGNFNEHWQIEAGYYAQPPIPPELTELQRENAELRKLLESNVPEGWQLVPAEPSQAMIDAGDPAFDHGYVADAYKAMLAAAPQPKEPKQ